MNEQEQRASTPPNVLPELLPCPFCGVAPSLRQSHTTERWLIECEHPRCGAEPVVAKMDKELAIAAWNTRHAPAVRDEDAVRELREALQECADALASSYDVTEWPATCACRQYVAMRKARALIGGGK